MKILRCCDGSTSRADAARMTKIDEKVVPHHQQMQLDHHSDHHFEAILSKSLRLHAEGPSETCLTSIVIFEVDHTLLSKSDL